MKCDYKVFIIKMSKKNKGFTLIEIIIAFAIFAIMMGGIYGIVISAMNTNKAGEVKQKAALYGQQIFEDIKSGEVNKDEHGQIKISNNILLNKDSESKYSWNGYLDDKNNYYAHIEMNKNNSILLDDYKEKDSELLESESDLIDKTFNFNITLKGDSTPIRIKVNNIENGKLEYHINSNENIKLIINTKIEKDKKVLIIKDKNNKEIFKGKIDIKDEDEKKPIKLNFNFSEYKVLNTESSEGKYRNIDIDVFNQDESPLNIVLNKSEQLDVKVNNKLGTVRIYDNRTESNEPLKNEQLYDIKIEIKKKPNDTTSVFTGYSSQNINIE